MELTTNIALKLLTLFLFDFLIISAQDFNYGFCADPECSIPVAFGHTTLGYNSPDSNKLSFKPNQEVYIFVKDYGEKKELLGVKINGVTGYAPKNFIREEKKYVNALVPAKMEFIQAQFMANSYHVSSHIHESSHIHLDVHHHDMHTHHDIYQASHSMQHSVPNNLDLQHSSQSFQHSSPIVHHSNQILQQSSPLIQHSNQVYQHSNPTTQHFTQGFQHGSFSIQTDGSQGIMPSSQNLQSGSHGFLPLESSSYNQWQSEVSQFHGSSDLHVSSKETVRNSHSQSENISPLQIESSSLGHFESQPATNRHHSQSENISPLQIESSSLGHFESQPAMASSFTPASNSEINRFQSSNFQHLESQWPKPSSSIQFEPAFTSGNIRQPVDHQNFFSDQTSHPLLPEGTISNHIPQSNFMSGNQNSDPEFDKTMAMLQNQGYEMRADLTEQFPSEYYNENSVPSSVQNTHSQHQYQRNNHHNIFPEGFEAGRDLNHQVTRDFQSNAVFPSPQSFHANQLGNDATNIQQSEFSVQSSFSKSQLDLSSTSQINNVQNTPSNIQNKPDVELIKSSVTFHSEHTQPKKSAFPNDESIQPIENKKFFTKDYNDLQIIESESPLDDDDDDDDDDYDGYYEENTEVTENIDIEVTENIDIDKLPLNESKEIEHSVVSLDNLVMNKSLQQSDSILTANENVDPKINIKSDSDILSIVDSKVDVTNMSNTNLLVSTDPSNLLTRSEATEMESVDLINAYQTRHLKDIETNNNDNITPVEETEQIISDSEFNLVSFLENSFNAIRSFIEALLEWIPEPLYTIIIDLEKKGISPKVPVFTALSSIPCIVLIVLTIYIKEKSKEKKLIAHLTILERNFYDLKEEKNGLEEKMGKMEVELQLSRTLLEEEKLSSFKLKTEVDCLKQQVEELNSELEKNIDIIDGLRERDREYAELVRDHEKEHLNLVEQKTEIENKLLSEEEFSSNLNDQLQEKETEVQKLLLEKSELSQANEVYEEKINLLQKNCNQLLQEAEVWNARVQELTEKLNKESSNIEELDNSLKEKNNEIEALSQAVQVFKSFEDIKGDEEEEDYKSNEEKLQYLINSSSTLIKLQKQVEENNQLSERLSEEKNKLLEMEVSLMDIKSDNDKLKLNYNQALQDKAEAQTKLDVLTNYFKDKEIQLQKQLGVQEAVRQKTEQDASSAERRICLIEKENSSYKYQVATMKQEMEETERNLKTQIAVQEKKAHENWLAARTAERKLEDTKQEVMQLRQRLTLLEREQENWSNSARDEIIRPVAKRITNTNDDSLTNQDSNSSLELRPNIFPPPPMMLPPDRPLPPLPPLPPPFLPPFEPPPFRPQPWHMPPDSNSEYRMTPPPGYVRDRESTPPRGRNSCIVDGDMGPRQSSPILDMRDSRNSTPPHLLPDFHDIPPHPPRPPFYPPMGPGTRFPPPNFKRGPPQGQRQRRIDNIDDNTSFGSQSSSMPPQENWHNPNSRV